MNENQNWDALREHFENIKDNINIAELFSSNPKRFNEFSLCLDNLLYDYSKQRVTRETLNRLLDLAHGAHLKQKIEDLFSGKKINVTENRSVLHTALRDFSTKPLYIDGKDIKEEVLLTLCQMEAFVEGIHGGEICGITGKPFTDILCLGIGGSELGPLLVSEALTQYKTSDLRLHFVSNCFGEQLASKLHQLNPETTLCIVSSKTFTTPETLINAQSVLDWMQSWAQSCNPSRSNKCLSMPVQDPKSIFKHFVAVTANKERAADFGILPENIFEFWDWVGGRYSIWSAVGLPVALLLGMSHFKAFLRGAKWMDAHFYTAPFEQNMPVIMALLGIWNVNFWGAATLAIVPYDNRLDKFPDYLQQLEMESNGKSTNIEKNPVKNATAPVIWGGIGCNAQHAFMQLLHQGTQMIPVDFLIAARGDDHYPNQHNLLFASCLSQSKALMEGASDKVFPAKMCPGNRPSSTLVFSDLTPHMLGALIALYEHKVFVQGVIWGINSFDQFGVELGKQLAKKILASMDESDEDTDSSSLGLMQFFRSYEKETGFPPSRE